MFFLTGKWVPTIARKIDAENQNALVKINLRGIGIGDGLMSPQDSAIYGDQLYQAICVDIIARYIHKLNLFISLDGTDRWNN